MRTVNTNYHRSQYTQVGGGGNDDDAFPAILKFLKLKANISIYMIIQKAVGQPAFLIVAGDKAEATQRASHAH